MVSRVKVVSRIFLLSLFIVGLGACGGNDENPSTPSFTISGTVTGLAGSGLVLQNNNGNDLAISANGNFNFTTLVADGGSYHVTVLRQPGSPSQLCSVSNGASSVGGADVIDITISCVTNTYTIGGSITGLAGSGLVLQNNGSDELAISADGSFSFATAVTDGGSYSVSVLNQPTSPNQTCSVTSGGGTINSADVTDININCTTTITPPASYTISGTVTGLAGSGLVLQNNGGDELGISTDGSYSFITAVADGGSYSVSVLSQPGSPNQTCSVSNASGTVSGADVTNVSINCSSTTYTIGGTVTGLAGTGLVLQNNGGDDLTTSADGNFTFGTSITDGGSYSVSVLSQPGSPNQTCSISNASGTVSGADVTNVSINCSTTTYTIGGLVTGLAGTGLVLQNNGGDDLTISADGSFTFGTSITDGGSYSVSVVTQPTSPDQDCSVTNATGSVSGSVVSGISVSCSTVAGGPLQLSVSAFEPKLLTFSWNDVGAAYYKLLKNPDAATGYSQIGGNIVGTSVDEEVSVHFQDWVNASYLVQSCDASDVCTDSTPISATSAMLDAIGYFKASNTDAGDVFGWVMALSADGTTLVVGANGEDSLSTGINGDQSDVEEYPYGWAGTGAVYVFVRSGTSWIQQAYVKASNTMPESFNRSQFGRSLALSADGNTLAVGAPLENSDAIGINGDQSNANAGDAGAVYVFVRSGTDWAQQAYVKASNTDALDRFGWSVALSDDGNTLAVGASHEDSPATGVNGDQGNSIYGDSGAAYVFARSGTSWSQEAYVKASNTSGMEDRGDWFGWSVALSGDGNTLAVGAKYEDSMATGINGDGTNNSAGTSGAVYVYIRGRSGWQQQAYVKASNTDGGDVFGNSVALTADGNILVVGAHGEDSVATGINGDQADDSVNAVGAVYVFARNGKRWNQQAYIKSSSGEADNFGGSVAISGDGSTLVVGAAGELSAATGINGDQLDNSANLLDSPYSPDPAGAAYVFTFSGGVWSQQAYVKASNTDAGDWYGRSVAVSDDGNTVAVGAIKESSAATGVNGDQADNSAYKAGAVYLY